MCKFLFVGLYLYAKILQTFLYKTCAIRFLMSQAFQKAKFYQNLTTESGSKQRFSLLREKAAGSVPEDLGSQYKSPILGPKKGFWVFRKSPKILTASDQYFLSYVKKNKLPGMG